MGLLNWWRLRRQARRRQIFRFWDGERIRGIDPLAVIRGLAEHPTFDASVHPVEARCHDYSIANRAYKIIADAVSDVFGVQSYDGATGKGLLEAERATLYAEFQEYISALKKNGEPNQTISGATAEHPNQTPNTSDTLGSCSTFPDSTPAAPTPC